jgi:hypothetical protein
MSRSLKIGLKIASISLVIAACGYSPDSKLTSFVTTVDRWPDPENIPVCWVNPEETSEKVKTDIKNHVQSKYHSKTVLRFIGWETCTSEQFDQAVIRIFIRRDGNFGSGRSLVGAKIHSGLSHGGTMEISGVKNWPRRGNTFLKRKVLYASLHEFGHAIGLRHEHERLDATGCEHHRKGLPNNAEAVGEYDTVSVMNYCSKSSAWDLSSGDVAGIEHMYGK